MKRKIILMTVVCSMAFSLCACGAKEEPVKEEATNQTEQAEDEAAEPEMVEEQTKEVEKEEAQDFSEDDTAFEAAKIRHKYADVLSQLTCASSLPDMEAIEPWYDLGYEMSDNQFAISDVDQDGREELVISYTTASMAGMFEVIYAYNPDTDELTQELLYSPGMEFYDNGMIKAPTSHNQTPSEFWPFNIMKYNADSDSYEEVAYIEAWDKSFSETLYGETSFPTELDKDGDGILYSILMVGEEFEGASNYKYDQADYEKWMDENFGVCEELEVSFKSVDYDNFSMYPQEYFEALKLHNKDNMPMVTTDIAEILYDKNQSIEDVKNELMSKYNLEVYLENDDFEESEMASYNGVEVLNFYMMDGGSITYMKEKVEDLTLFGMYPGMDEAEAKKYLEAYGFYPSEYDENQYITGVGIDNRSVYLTIENGKIASIATGWFCMFVG